MSNIRHRPHVVSRVNVACQSSRQGHVPTLIVLHDTEGGNIPHSHRDLDGLGAFFNRIGTQASAHVGVDRDGNSARWVDDSQKAWSCFPVYNLVTLNIEQVGFATDDWTSKSVEAQLEEVARWCAVWSLRHNIPLRHITHPTPNSRGITQHRALGALGGSHHDINPKYPVGHVIKRAQYHRMHLARA